MFSNIMVNKKTTVKTAKTSDQAVKRTGRRITQDYEYNPFEDTVYIRQMQEAMSENLDRGNNVLSMANGDLVVTETKVTQYIFKWDREKKKLNKSTIGKPTSDKK